MNQKTHNINDTATNNNSPSNNNPPSNDEMPEISVHGWTPDQWLNRFLPQEDE